MTVREAENALLDAIANYMRAGGEGEELVEMAEREAEWWAEERAALAERSDS